MKLTRKQFNDSIWSQHDSGGYDPHGWIAGVHGTTAYLTQFGHCSCYGTWEAVTGGGISDYWGEDEIHEFVPDWSGTLVELIEMAEKRLDPNMPTRKITPSDYDASYLRTVYDDVVTRGTSPEYVE